MRKKSRFEGGPRFLGAGGPLTKVPRFHLYELEKSVFAAVWPHVSVVYVANLRVVLVTLPRLRCRAS